MLHNLHSRYNRKVIEQAAIAGVLSPEIYRRCRQRPTRPPTTSPGGSTRWPTRSSAAGPAASPKARASRSSAPCAASRTSPSSTTPCSARPTRASSTNTRAKLQEAYPQPGMLRRKDTETAIHGPVSLFEAVTDAGRKGVALQRYKGLGEMNPEPALGNHARHQRALAAAGEDQGGRRGRRHLHQADGRRGRAAPRIHPGKFAQRQRRRVRKELRLGDA